MASEADEAAAIRKHLRHKIRRARDLIRGDFTHSGKSIALGQEMLDEVERLLRMNDHDLVAYWNKKHPKPAGGR